MVLYLSKLSVIDNSGAKVAQCIKVLNKSPKRSLKIGDDLIISIKKRNIKSKSKVLKGDIYKSVLVHTKKKYRRLDGTSISFDANTCVLLNKNDSLISSRVFGIIPIELVKSQKSRLKSISNITI
uniref:Ribosomal protein L14 n=1 Tax=Imasa heleensis TaxID=2772037 RepID=A0A893DD12_9EUKA|nr:ribosomal protein L14 [Imasa heleensis]QRR29744.1 ribosomal protein L14 [Imasa heleensis]